MIRLLNGEVFEKEELLKKMVDDSFYYGELQKNVLSYSSMKLLLQSPKKYKYITEYGQPETQALRDGKLIHTAVLEPAKLRDLHFVDVASKRTKKYALAIVNYGKENVFTRKELNEADRITDAVLKNETAKSYLNKAQVEVPAIEMIQNLPVRGKADILREDMVVDLKTTSSGIKAFEYVIDKYDYDLQAYLYTQLYNKPRFTFLVVDKGTLDLGEFEVGPETLERGKAKLDAAIQLYNAFFVEKYVDLDNYIFTKKLK